MEEGYPAYVIYIVLGIGTLLLFYRPYWVLYGIILLICSIDLQSAIYTRTPLAGPYLNLIDALLLELLLTMFFILKAQKLPFLWIREVGLVILVLIVSAITIGMRESYEYEVLREIRWTLSFPIAFIVMANVVRTGKEILPLLF